MPYREWLPPPALAAMVQCVWTSPVGWSARPRHAWILPDGCTDIVWTGAALLVAGPDTAPVPVALPEGAVVVGVRFVPGQAAGFLGAPASAITDSRVALAELWPEAPSLQQRVADAPTAGAAAAVLVEALVERRRGVEPDLLVAEAVELIAAGTSPGALSPALGLGERQLRRRVTAAVGYPPAVLRRILRLQSFLNRADAMPDAGLAALGVAVGYADQAHLGREVRALTGMTPATLVA